jgi:peptide/nickel transport system permease protein
VVRTLARRLATAALTLLLVTVVVFGLIHLAPGEPLGEESEDLGMGRLSPQARAELRAQYRLDQPLHRQYLLWIGDLARGDLGRSFHDRRPVIRKIGERLPLSVTLNALALATMITLSVPLGALAALRAGSAWDRVSAVGTYVLFAVPVFWAALMLQIVFAARLDWLPLAGLRSDGFDTFGRFERWADRGAHLVLPVVCLSYGGLAYLSRFVRATLLDGSAPESWRAARARGLSSCDTASARPGSRCSPWQAFCCLRSWAGRSSWRRSSPCRASAACSSKRPTSATSRS